jgi:hypothetical protein
MTIEPPFWGQAFKDALELFEQHRKEIRKKLTPTARSLMYKRWAKWGEARATAAILYSIEQGWTGVFEEKQNGNGHHASTKASRTEDAFAQARARTAH